MDDRAFGNRDVVAIVVTNANSAMRERLSNADGVELVEVVPLGAAQEDLEGVLAGADVFVILDTAVGPEIDGTGGSVFDPATSGSLIEVARSAGIRRIVYVSSAMVYGAWPDTPVPITEDAPVRPVPESAYAVAKAEVEKRLAEWRRDDPGVAIAVLRPVVVVDPARARWFPRSPWGRIGSLISPAEVHRQFLHVDDLVAAVETARINRLDGVFNVAPDGWLAPDVRRDLDGVVPPLPVPGALITIAGRIRSWFGLSPIPSGLESYIRFPWVVSNDRLRAVGWAPAHTNEEAYIEAVPQGRLASIGVRRRQKLSLALLGATVVSVGVGLVLLLRHHRSRRTR